jgi:hypothetical protein
MILNYSMFDRIFHQKKHESYDKLPLYYYVTDPKTIMKRLSATEFKLAQNLPKSRLSGRDQSLHSRYKVELPKLQISIAT